MDSSSFTFCYQIVMKNSICLYKISEILKQLDLNSLKFVLRC